MRRFSLPPKLGAALLAVLVAVGCEEIIQQATRFEQTFTISFTNIELTAAPTLTGIQAQSTDTAFYKQEVDVAQYYADWQQYANYIDSLNIDSVQAVFVNHGEDTAWVDFFVSDDSTLTYNDLYPPNNAAPTALWIFSAAIAPGETLRVNGANYTTFIPNYPAPIPGLVSELMSGYFWFYAIGAPKNSVDVTVESYNFFVRIQGNLNP